MLNLFERNEIEPTFERDRKRALVRWVLLLFAWALGYFAYQIGMDESVAGWLRVISLVYFLISTLLVIVVISVVIWRLSKLIGPDYSYPWWML
jgi:hypothetical protein